MMVLAENFTTLNGDVMCESSEGTMIERIQGLMKLRGWNQAILARKAGISTSALSNIMSGRRKELEGETLRKLAEALQVTVDYLIGTGPRSWSTNNLPLYTKEAEEIARMVEAMPEAARATSLQAVSTLYEYYRQHKERTEMIDALLDIIESNHGLDYRRDLERRFGLPGQEVSGTDEAVTL